jgi:hypothetical protein
LLARSDLPSSPIAADSYSFAATFPAEQCSALVVSYQRLTMGANNAPFLCLSADIGGALLAPVRFCGAHVIYKYVYRRSCFAIYATVASSKMKQHYHRCAPLPLE